MNNERVETHLGSTEVMEVDGIEVRVFLVPSKKGAPHAKVGHGCGHTCWMQ